MEFISLEDRHDNKQSERNNSDSNDNSSRRVPTLRDSARCRKTGESSCKLVAPMQQSFFPLLCIAQTILIGIILIYLYWFQQPHGQQLQRESLRAIDDAKASTLSKYRVYTGGDGSVKARFLVDLPSGCDQRRHDIKFGSVKCSSKDVSGCGIRDAGVPKFSDGQVAQIITTTRAGKRLQESRWVPLEEVADCPPTFSGKSSCEFLDSRTKLLLGHVEKQSIIGWGGALTDSSINNILSLSTNGTMQVLEDYFGADGLQFNMVRITIGSSDFSARFYTNNDKKNPDDPDDVGMSNFQLTPEDTLYKIPVIKHIQSKYGSRFNFADEGGIKLFASMWSPPTWMKTNNHFNKGQLKGSISMANATGATEERYYQALAELKKRFLLAYQENSIKFWGMTVMNEPVFAVQPFLDFNTMIFPRHNYADYIAKYLGPTLRGHPELSHIKLMAHDDNRRFLLDFTRPTLTRPESGRYIDGVSVHGYADKDYHQMETIYKLGSQRDLFVLPTELCSGHLPWMQKALAGNWHRGVHYALDIIHSLQHSAAGWVDWNMALDMKGGPGWLGGRLDSPVLIDKDHDLYHKSPMYYVLGQFSRYIPPGSVRIESSLVNGAYNYPLETVTFRLPVKPKGSWWLVTVVLNANPHPVKLHLKPFGSRKLFLIECEPDSVTTIRYDSRLGKVDM